MLSGSRSAHCEVLCAAGHPAVVVAADYLARFGLQCMALFMAAMYTKACSCSNCNNCYVCSRGVRRTQRWPTPTRDALLRVAQLMDALALERAQQGHSAAALSLYLLALQVTTCLPVCLIREARLAYIPKSHHVQGRNGQQHLALLSRMQKHCHKGSAAQACHGSSVHCCLACSDSKSERLRQQLHADLLAPQPLQDSCCKQSLLCVAESGAKSWLVQSRTCWEMPSQHPA